MIKPVVAADGFSYEERAIKRWLQASHLSPVLGTPLPHKGLVENRTLRCLIREKNAGRNFTFAMPHRHVNLPTRLQVLRKSWLTARRAVWAAVLKHQGSLTAGISLGLMTYWLSYGLLSPASVKAGTLGTHEAAAWQQAARELQLLCRRAPIGDAWVTARQQDACARLNALFLPPACRGGGRGSIVPCADLTAEQMRLHALPGEQLQVLAHVNEMAWRAEQRATAYAPVLGVAAGLCALAAVGAGHAYFEHMTTWAFAPRALR